MDRKFYGLELFFGLEIGARPLAQLSIKNPWASTCLRAFSIILSIYYNRHSPNGEWLPKFSFHPCLSSLAPSISINQGHPIHISLPDKGQDMFSTWQLPSTDDVNLFFLAQNAQNKVFLTAGPCLQ